MLFLTLESILWKFAPKFSGGAAIYKVLLAGARKEDCKYSLWLSVNKWREQQWKDPNGSEDKHALWLTSVRVEKWVQPDNGQNPLFCPFKKLKQSRIVPYILRSERFDLFMFVLFKWYGSVSHSGIWTCTHFQITSLMFLFLHH